MKALAPLGARLASTGLVGLLVLTIGIGLGWQLHADRQAAQVQRSQDASLAQHARAVDQGASAVSAHQSTVAGLAENQATLQQEIPHARLVVRTACPAVAPRAAVGAAAPVLSADLPSAPEAPARFAELDQAVDARHQLAHADPGGDVTLGGLRLWNSALAGRPVAAGACSPDDPGAPACALASGRTFQDLWANHTLNASLCAQDRSQLDELTGLLRQLKEH